MSNLEVEFAKQAMEESGEMQFIRDHVAAANDTPAAEADTVEETEEVVEEPAVEEGTEAEEAAMEDEGAPTLTAEEEEVLYLELDDDTQNLIDTKYGGDINKALSALKDGQSLIGRQGQELGELRTAMDELRTLVERGQVMSQPYTEWPDEYAEPQDAAMAFRSIAEQAFDREDVDMFGTAVDAWMEQDPAGASTYRDLKILQMQTAIGPYQPPVNDQATLESGTARVKEKFPQFASGDPAFMAAFDSELQKFPTLKALLWGEIPGTTPDQRISALEETVGRVASQFTAETEQAARRRVAVRTSEEARQARREARVTSGETARVVAAEPEPRTVPMGTTGRSLDIDRLNSMLPEADRL